MAARVLTTTVALVAVVLVAVPGACAQLQQLDAAWSATAKEFATSVAGVNNWFSLSVQNGEPTHSGGQAPPVNNTVMFDADNKVNLDAVPASQEFKAMAGVCTGYLSDVVGPLVGMSAGAGSANSTLVGGGLSQLFSAQTQPAFQTFVNFVKEFASPMVILAGSGGTFEGGGGMGFGVNVLDCQQRTVLSMGAGIGFGVSSTADRASIYNSISAGMGGGGGITVWSYDGPNDKTGTVVANLGGGGGGGVLSTNGVYTPSFGSTPDPDQTPPSSMAAAFKQAQAGACTPLTMSGSGGGGGGFLTAAPDPTFNMNYGGGNAFGLGAQYSSGGTPSGSGSGDGAAIGKVYSGCRLSCQASAVSSSSNPNAFYSCFCPCTKKGLTAIGAPWAAVITCPAA